jgi:hypothetical protein
MAAESVVRKPNERAPEPAQAVPQAAYVKKMYSPEYLAEHEAVMARVREEGAIRIRRSVEKAIEMGIIDKDGNRLKKDLPADMQPGADRDFRGIADADHVRSCRTFRQWKDERVSWKSVRL